MKFSVPQFIEREARIAGPLTFRQLLYLLGAGLVIVLFYYSLAKTNPTLFTVITIILLGIASAFAFLKIGGYSFGVFLKNFLGFLRSSKVYIWEKRMSPIRIEHKKITTKKEEDKKPSLNIIEKSKLKELSNMMTIK